MIRFVLILSFGVKQTDDTVASTLMTVAALFDFLLETPAMRPADLSSATLQGRLCDDRFVIRCSPILISVALPQQQGGVWGAVLSLVLV